MHKREQNAAYLAAGAILHPEAELPKDARADTLSARRYSHPALGERPVVRLTQDALGGADDIALGFLGFSLDGVDEGIGKRKRQALGFPEWVLVNEPKKSRAALDAASQMHKAAGRAKSKPGHAKEAFDELGAKLEKANPTFLPTYYEQAGRTFLELGKGSYAGTMFGKARLAEQVYALPVDESVRREAFLEFALAGALTNKVMSAYAADLAKRYGAEEAYEEFFNICVRRTLGGSPPNVATVKTLRKMAKAAGHKTAAEDERFVGQVWDSPVMGKAHPQVWLSYKKPIVKLAKASPKMRGRLLNLFPSPTGEVGNFKDDWLQLLVEAGAVGALTVAPGEVESTELPEDGVAAWFARAHDYTPGSWWRRSTKGQPDVLFQLLRDAAPVILAEGGALTFDHDGHYYSSRIDPDFGDLAIELGLSLAAKASDQSLCFGDLSQWATTPEGSVERPRDLAHLCRTPALREPLADVVRAALNTEVFRSAILDKPELLSVAEEILVLKAESMASGGLPTLVDGLEFLNERTDANLIQKLDAFREAVAKIELVPALRNTLAVGLFDELTWPAFESAHRELSDAIKDDTELQYQVSFPFIILYNQVTAIAVGPRGELARHDFKLPKDRRPRNLFYADGQLLVTFYDAEYDHYAYWSGKPTDRFKLSVYGNSPDVCAPLDDGGVVYTTTVLRPGDRTIPHQYGQNVSDNSGTWVREGWGDDITYVEVDPSNGKKGRTSMPAFFSGLGSADYTLQRQACRLVRVGDVPHPEILGVKDGVLGWCQRTRDADKRIECVGIDGRSYQRDAATGVVPSALAKWPGGGQRLITSAGDLAAEDGTFIGSHLEEATSALKHLSDTNFAAFMAPRNSAISALLRATSDAHCSRGLSMAIRQHLHDMGGREALETLASELAEAQGGEGANFPTLKAFVENWLGQGQASTGAKKDEASSSSDHEATLVQSVEDVFVRAAFLAERLISLQVCTDPNAAPVGCPADEDFNDIVLRNFYFSRIQSWGVRDDMMGKGAGEFMAALGNFLFRGELAPEPPAPDIMWCSVWGLEGGFAWAALAPHNPPGYREAVAKFLRSLARNGFLSFEGKVRYFDGDYSAKKAESWLGKRRLKDDEGQLFISYGESRYLVALNRWGDGYWAVEYAPNGNFTALPGVEIEGENPIVPGLSAEMALRLADALDDGFELPWDPEIGQALAEKTGVLEAAAALIWMGVPNLKKWEANFLPKPLRTQLKLKVKDADVARQDIKALNIVHILTTLGRALPEDLASLKEPLVGEPSPVERLANAWKKQFGKKVAVDLEFIKHLKKGVPNVEVKTLAAALVEPMSSDFVEDQEWSMAREENDGFIASPKRADCDFDTDLFGQIYSFLSFVLYTSPVGEGLAARPLYELVCERLTNPTLLLQIGGGYIWGEEREDANLRRTLEAYGPEIEEHAEGGLLVDAGVLVASYGDGYLRVHLRPARLLAGEKHPLFPGGIPDLDTKQLDFVHLFTPNFRALLERAETSPLDHREYETNPMLSAPEVVKSIGTELGLTTEAAALYIQVLALPDPTSKNVKTWNGWSAKVYKKACAELVEEGLLLEAKRSRAGRAHFLPGGWENLSKPALPLETYKTQFLDISENQDCAVVPSEPVHALFARVWRLYQSGNQPG